MMRPVEIDLNGMGHSWDVFRVPRFGTGRMDHTPEATTVPSRAEGLYSPRRGSHIPAQGRAERRQPRSVALGYVDVARESPEGAQPASSFSGRSGGSPSILLYRRDGSGSWFPCPAPSGLIPVCLPRAARMPARPPHPLCPGLGCCAPSGRERSRWRQTVPHTRTRTRSVRSTRQLSAFRRAETTRGRPARSL